MKKVLFLICFATSILLYSQEKNEKKQKRFYTASVHATFALNPNYVLFDRYDGENMFDFSAIFIRNGLGYRFNKRFTGSVNVGIDFHIRLGLQNIPTYFNAQYNIFENNDNGLFFIDASVGKLWKPSSNFDKGDYYAFGLGWQIGGVKNANSLIKIDFHRKKILGLNKGNLDSISLGFGVTLF